MDQPIDYYYDLSQDGDTKRCVTYAYGVEIDRREDDTGEKSFTDLMAEALPAIQSDIDTYGIAT